MVVKSAPMQAFIEFWSKNGDEIYARIIVSNLDAKRTFTKVMDRKDLPPGVFEKASNFKIRGSSGKVNIALSGLPKFTGVPENRYVDRGGQGFVDSLETMESAYIWVISKIHRDVAWSDKR